MAETYEKGRTVEPWPVEKCDPAPDPHACKRCGAEVCGCATHQAWCNCWYTTEEFIEFMREQRRT